MQHLQGCVQDPGRPDRPHQACARGMEVPQPEDLHLLRVRKAVHQEVPRGQAHADPHRREAPQVHRLRPLLQQQVQPDVSHPAGAQEAVSLHVRHVSRDLQAQEAATGAHWKGENVAVMCKLISCVFHDMEVGVRFPWMIPTHYMIIKKLVRYSHL